MLSFSVCGHHGKCAFGTFPTVVPNTCCKVSTAALGTMTFGVQNSEADAHAQIEYFLASSGNLIDTAEMSERPPSTERTVESLKRLCFTMCPTNLVLSNVRWDNTFATHIQVSHAFHGSPLGAGADGGVHWHLARQAPRAPRGGQLFSGSVFTH